MMVDKTHSFRHRRHVPAEYGKLEDSAGQLPGRDSTPAHKIIFQVDARFIYQMLVHMSNNREMLIFLPSLGRPGHGEKDLLAPRLRPQHYAGCPGYRQTRPMFDPLLVVPHRHERIFVGRKRKPPHTVMERSKRHEIFPGEALYSALYSNRQPELVVCLKSNHGFSPAYQIPAFGEELEVYLPGHYRNRSGGIQLTV